VRAHRIAVFTLAYFAGLALLVAALFLADTTTASRPAPDCAAVDYHDGVWWNAQGQQVAWAVEEDAVVHYVPRCR
jgi:hypothetical protein